MNGTMDKEVILLLVGAGIALVSSLVTALVQHVLQLRTDRVKRTRDEDERVAKTMKKLLKKRATESLGNDGVLRAWSRRRDELHSLEALLSGTADELSQDR